MGAPRLENIFGISGIRILPLDQIPERFTKDFARYYYPNKDHPTVINALKLDDSHWPTEGMMFAEKKEDVDKWVQTYLNPKGKVDNHVAVHALWKDPDDTHVLDNPTSILPLQADYAPNILYSKGP